MNHAFKEIKNIHTVCLVYSEPNVKLKVLDANKHGNNKTIQVRDVLRRK